MKRQVEVFTANCPVCQPVVDMVHDLACNNCEITTYNLDQNPNDETALSRINTYQIKQLPAIIVDGHLLDCCKSKGVTEDELIKAGIGQG